VDGFQPSLGIDRRWFAPKLTKSPVAHFLINDVEISTIVKGWRSKSVRHKLLIKNELE
jgi:hypothetical protein